MKLKHINILERYVERAVVALAAIFFGLVFWFFFWGGPYNVSIPSAPDQTHIAPDQVEEYLYEKAQQLKAAINSPNSHLPQMNVLPYAAEFKQAVLHRRAIDISTFLFPFGQPGLDKDKFVFIEKPPTHYDVPVAPAPSLVKARADHYVLQDIPDPAIAKAYAALIGVQPQLPKDFSGVTVWASYDMDAMRQAYMSVPTDRQVHPGWWQQDLKIADVVLERQTYDPATNRWGDDAEIQPLPDDSANYRNIPPDIPQSEANAMLDAIRVDQDLVARPNFAPVVPDHPWIPPVTQGGEEIEPRLDRNRESRVVGAPRQIHIWAHDLTVRPGTTYRYRLAVSLLDPLYRRPSLDNEQFQTYYNALMLPPSIPSEWSAPVTIDPENYFFLVDANASRRTARVEVWRIFNGAWCFKTFDVQPGDMIGKMQTMSYGATNYNVNFRLDAMVVDIDFNAQTSAVSGTTVGLLVLNNATGAILTKTKENDLEDRIRNRLRKEIAAPNSVAEN